MSSFDGASLNDLRAMIANADPSGLDAVASKWSAVHEALRQAQEDLLHHTLAATNHWQGAAADAFSARADQLHQSLGNGAAYAFNAASGVSFAADSLRGAQAAMPAGALSLEGIAAAQQATTAGVTAAQFDDHQRQQAAVVMRRLEQEYVAAGEMIGTPGKSQRFVDHGEFHTSPPASRESAEMARSSLSIQHNHSGDTLAMERSQPINQVSPPSTIATSNLDSSTANHYKRSSGPPPTLQAPKEGIYATREAADTAPGAATGLNTFGNEADSFNRDNSLSSPKCGPASIAATTESPRPGTWLEEFSVPAAHRGRRLGDVSQLSPADDQVRRKQEIPDFGPAQDYSIAPKDVNGNNSETRLPSSKGSQIPGEFGTLAPGLPTKTPKNKRKRPTFLIEDPGNWTPPTLANPPVIE